MGIAQNLIGGGKMPTPPPIPPIPPMAHPATAANSQVTAAGASAKAKAAAAAMNGGGTNPTGAQGLSQPISSAPATLLGSTSR